MMKNFNLSKNQYFKYTKWLIHLLLEFDLNSSHYRLYYGDISSQTIINHLLLLHLFPRFLQSCCSWYQWRHIDFPGPEIYTRRMLSRRQIASRNMKNAMHHTYGRKAFPIVSSVPIPVFWSVVCRLVPQWMWYIWI